MAFANDAWWTIHRDREPQKRMRLCGRMVTYPELLEKEHNNNTSTE